MQQWRKDLGSKFFDGIIAALLLYLLLFLAILLIGPIEARAGRPGLLIYCITLIAISIYCLEHSLLTRIPESYRAWYGMFGGIMAWSVIHLGSVLGNTSPTNIGSILGLLLITLTVTRLWRRHLPLGARFYCLTLLTAWIGQGIINGQVDLVAWQPVMNAVYLSAGVVALLAAVGILGWIFTRTDWRVQRLYAAPLLSLSATLAAYILL